MNSYPDAVTKIVDDYLERVGAKLRGLPEGEQREFVMEIQSHIYEAYQNTAGEDEVGRILPVLRNLGEPGEVVADRLPGTMLRTGARLKRPLYVVGGILIALLALPLGAWAVGALVGLLSGLAGLLIAYYAVTGSVLLVGGLCLLLGMARIGAPGIWDSLTANGFIQMGGPFEVLNQMPPVVESVLMLVVACVLIATGLGMLWVGKYMLRGLRFVGVVVSEKAREVARRVRGKLRERSGGDFRVREAAMGAK